MATPILKISKDPVTLTIRKAKVVEGNFGPQLWCAVADAQGEEHTLYLPAAPEPPPCPLPRNPVVYPRARVRETLTCGGMTRCVS